MDEHGEVDPHLGVEERRTDGAARVDHREHRRRGHVAEAGDPGGVAIEVDGIILPHRLRVLADLLLAHLVRVGGVGLALCADVNRQLGLPPARGAVDERSHVENRDHQKELKRLRKERST